MANFTPTKHDASTINGGMQFNNGVIPQKEAFNNTIENSLYAVQQSDEAIRKVKEFEETEPLAKGTVVFENGKAQINWDADKKLDKDKITANFNQINKPENIEIPVAEGINFTASNGTLTCKGTSNDFIPARYNGFYLNLNTKHIYYLTHNLHVNSGDRPKVYIGWNNSLNQFNASEKESFVLKDASKLFNCQIYRRSPSTFDFTCSPIIIDLTEMFGAGNEPQTVAEVQQYIPAGTYYPYQLSNAELTTEVNIKASQADVNTLATKVETNAKNINTKINGLVYKDTRRIKLNVNETVIINGSNDINVKIYINNALEKDFGRAPAMILSNHGSVVYCIDILKGTRAGVFTQNNIPVIDISNGNWVTTFIGG